MELSSIATFLMAGMVWLHSSTAQPTAAACDSPVYCYGELLDMVQRKLVFTDSKTFVDRPLRASPDVILSSFAKQKQLIANNFTLLQEFVYNWTMESNSDLLPWIPDDWIEKPSFIAGIEDLSLRQWAYDINSLWRQLGRQVHSSVSECPTQHSLLSVPHPFIVPGGRFGEFYYWDTYWIVKGLLLCEMQQTARNMVINLISMVERFGMVPNGGRVYYSRRSQPPLLTQLVDLVYTDTGNRSFLELALPSLVREYQFWMEQRVMGVAGHTLNGYAVDLDTPRPESYREDLSTAAGLAESDRQRLYSQLGSAAESGWDFSSRWLSGPTLSSIRTKSIVPVDLNAILCQNEATLARLFREVGNTSAAALFEAAKASRRNSFDAIFWNETQGLWLDWNADTNRQSEGFYTSSLVPLLWGCGQNLTQHRLVLSALTRLGGLSYPGGLPTSLKGSGQQWDFPNVWAPHQWFPVLAWQQSADPELREAASSIAQTWIRSTYKGWEVFNHTMFEKYNCTVAGLPGGGGEYVIQDGFGWTNAVTLHFLSLFPKSSPGPGSTPSLGWVSAVVLLVVAAVLAVPCALLCRWLYTTGERRYWGRVHNQRNRQESISEDDVRITDDYQELVLMA